MKTDLYTKAVLSVIAISLSIIAFKDVNIISKSYAGSPNAAEYGLVPLNKDGSVTVRISEHDMLNVNIADITTTDELDINIDEIGGGYVSNGGPVPVKIKD